MMDGVARDLNGVWDLVVVGHGSAGLAAAVEYLEVHRAAAPRVAVIDRAPIGAHGRSPRPDSAGLHWSVRGQVAPDDAVLCGVPRGAANSHVALFERASELGAHFFVGTELVGLERSSGGSIVAARVRSTDGETVMSTDTVVLAPGDLDRELDELARVVRAGSHGGPLPEALLLGVGSAMSAATAVGAAMTEPYGGDRSIPVDPRSDRAMSIVGTWLCGILVGLDGRRFIDEGERAFEVQAEAVARAVLSRGGLAFAVTDASSRAAMPGFAALQNTDQPVITADSVAELAERLGMDSAILEETVAAYNAAIVAAPTVAAGATAALWPPKSSWARPLTEPPFEALPVGVQVASAHQGLRVDGTMRVVDTQRKSIPGLYAAGDVVGVSPRTGAPDDLPTRDAITAGRLAGRAAATVMLR